MHKTRHVAYKGISKGHLHENMCFHLHRCTEVITPKLLWQNAIHRPVYTKQDAEGNTLFRGFYWVQIYTGNESAITSNLLRQPCIRQC